MAENDHDVTIRDLETGTTINLMAVSSKNSKNSIEISGEAGVIGRIGPRNPRRFTWKLKAFGDNTADARSVWLQIDSLVGKPLTISARTLPSNVVWCLESVDPADDNQAMNSFDVDISAMELIGFSANNTGLVDFDGTLNLQLGTIVVPPNPKELTKEEEDNGDPTNPDGCTGQGLPKCLPGEQDTIHLKGILDEIGLSSFTEDVFSTIGDWVGGAIGGIGIAINEKARGIDNLSKAFFGQDVKRCI